MKNTGNQPIDTDNIEDQITEETPQTDNVSENSTTETLDAAKETAEWQDKYIRLSAEFDNYRKRTLKEKSELIQYGGSDVIKSILSTADDFDRALAAMQDGPDREGMRLIYQNFMDTLKSKGVAEIEATGKAFDVDFHEAVAKIPAQEEGQAGQVVDTIQKGYMLKDKILRFAKVVVAE